MDKDQLDQFRFLKRAGAPTLWEWILPVAVVLTVSTFASCGAVLLVLLRG